MNQTVVNRPILYSFRRCPYAMRARLALQSAGISFELREVLLKNKPAEMLALSPKGTVPVLQLQTPPQVIDESLEIMRWALQQADPEQWLGVAPAATEQLIADNDGEFKHWLDRYKYFERFPEHNQHYYRQQAEVFLRQWENRLADNNGLGLVAPRLTLADVALLPFVRQFAHCDLDWFSASDYEHMQRWLERFKASQRFKRAMVKQPQWCSE